MAYGDFKHLKWRTASDKILRDKAFNIAKNPKYDGYQRGLASIVYKFFDKKFASLKDKLYQEVVLLIMIIIIMMVMIMMILNRIYN